MIFGKHQSPDKSAEYRKALLQALPPLPAREGIQNLDFENEMENAMNDLGTTSVPQGLIDSHLRQIKDLSGQADEFEGESLRLAGLAKEARLGIAALTAANKVLEAGLPAPEKANPDYVLPTGLPIATGLPEAGK